MDTSSSATSGPKRLVMPIVSSAGARMAVAAVDAVVMAFASKIGARRRSMATALFGRVSKALAVAPRRRGQAAGCPVRMHNLVFPRQAIAASDEILHVGVGTVLSTAAHRGKATMSELIDVVLDRPMPARLAYQ